MSEIILSSQVSGRIKKILIKEWEIVKKWQPLVYISDSVANIWINLQQAWLWLEKAKINYDSTKISLDKQVSDSELALKKLKINLDTLIKDSEQNIKKASNDLDNSKYLNINSRSSLELEKLDNTIKKQELDYDSTLVSNEETINGFKSNFKKDYNSILVLMDDIIQFWDNILWVTNKRDSISSYIYIWWKNRSQKSLTEVSLADLINYRNWKFNTIKLSDLTTEELEKNLDYIMDWYEKTKLFLNNMEETINNSIESAWILSLTDILTYESTLDAYQSSNQANYSAFITSDNIVKSFLKNYKRSENSILKQIDLLKEDRELLKKNLSLWEFSAEVWYNKTIIASEDSITSLKIQIETYESNLKNAIDNRKVTLNSLKNSIDTANLSRNIAYKEYLKLTINSPIDWTISDILTDEWYEVNNWLPIIKLIWNSKTEVEISLSSNEIDKVNIWDNVNIIYDEKILNWIIFSKSTLSDDNLNYKVIIRLEDNVKLVWNIVSVEFEIISEKNLLPINIVKIIWNWNTEKHGEISVFKEWEIFFEEITLWDVYWDMIEFTIDEKNDDDDSRDKKSFVSTEVILTDVKNYDKEKFILKVKK